jgi:hypothetical protein
MKSSKISGLFCVIVIILSSVFCLGAEISDREIDREAKGSLVDKAVSTLLKNYIEEKMATELADHLSTKLKHGDYDSYSTAISLSQVLEEDMFEVSKDRHLGLVFDPGWAKQIRDLQDENSEAAREARRQEYENALQSHFGFKKLEILNGNIGYLDLRDFPNPEYGSETAIAAMNFLADTPAVIIDLRHNGGGWGEMVLLISSYFFEGTKEWNGTRSRSTGCVERAWTLPYIPGKRMTDTDLYLVTSSRTFSAAEDFCYGMKTLKRATIIGETTKGGAHPIEYFIIENDFILIVPNAASVNPITNSNWEGTGIEPDIAVPQEEALLRAHREALSNLLTKEKNDKKKFSLQWALNSLKALSESIILDPAVLQKYSGVYGERQIVFENEQLYYVHGVKYRLIPMSKRLFMLEGSNDARIEFSFDSDGQVTEMILLYQTGQKYPIKKTNKAS